MFDRDSAIPEGSPTTSPFLAHVYCGQTAGWMKTPLGREVDLHPGHIALDWVPALGEMAQQPHLLGPCLLWLRSPISVTAELLLYICLNYSQIVGRLVFFSCANLNWLYNRQHRFEDIPSLSMLWACPILRSFVSKIVVNGNF